MISSSSIDPRPTCRLRELGANCDAIFWFGSMNGNFMIKPVFLAPNSPQKYNKKEEGLSSLFLENKDTLIEKNLLKLNIMQFKKEGSRLGCMIASIVYSIHFLVGK